MATASETAEGMWTVFRSLSEESQEAFLERLMADRALRDEIEQLLDLALAEERSNEPVRSLDTVLAEIE